MTNLSNEEIQEFLDKKYIPDRFSGCDFETIDPVIKEKIIKAIEEDKGIYLFGGAGTGKTHILYSIFKKFLSGGVRKNSDGILYVSTTGIFFRDMVELSVRMKQSIKDESINWAEDLEDFCRAHLLFIDDLGAEKMSDFVFENFYLILNSRYKNKKKTFISSNYNLKELAEKVGDRISSRITEMCEVINVGNEDKRLTK